MVGRGIEYVGLEDEETCLGIADEHTGFVGVAEDEIHGEKAARFNLEARQASPCRKMRIFFLASKHKKKNVLIH